MINSVPRFMMLVLASLLLYMQHSDRKAVEMAALEVENARKRENAKLSQIFQ